jgi:hypothetical protein
LYLLGHPCLGRIDDLHHLPHIMNGIDVDDIDPFHPSLIKSQSIALCMVRDKMERYISKGRTLEAQGCKTSLRIMWQCFMEYPAVDTGWGEL